MINTIRNCHKLSFIQIDDIIKNSRYSCKRVILLTLALTLMLVTNLAVICFIITTIYFVTQHILEKYVDDAICAI